MQLFPRALNYLPLMAAAALGGGGAAATGAIWYLASPANLQVGYAPHQPIEYSHKLHADELGIDCRYCHANVENSQEAMIPPTQTCMGCHALVKPDSPKLEALRASWKSGKPVEWVRIHKLPDHVFFDHSAHVAVGVGCVNCHGRIDQMEVVMQVEPLSMGWCLDCHRNPSPHLRPADEVTNMDWIPPRDHAAFAARVIEEKNLKPPEDCTACHR